MATLYFGNKNNFYQFKLGLGQQYKFWWERKQEWVEYFIHMEEFPWPYLNPLCGSECPPIRADQTNKVFTRRQRRFWGPQHYWEAGFGKGWSELKIAPGVHAKTALRFDWGRFNNIISAAEAGFNFEYYPTDVEQMVGVEPNHFFINSYIAILFGSRK